MVIIKSSLLDQFKNIIFGFSAKIDSGLSAPYYFNLSNSVNDNPDRVKINREKLFSFLGIPQEKIVFQKQIHSDIVTVVGSDLLIGESDAMITNQKGIGLAVSSADCCAVFIYDAVQKIIAAVHSGWRGTQKGILDKTILKFKEEFNSHPKNLFAYIAPSISQKNYEVGNEVAVQFNRKYLFYNEGKIFLDVTTANYDKLLSAGLTDNQIQISKLCSYQNSELLHSYRREGQHSGRALGILFMKKE